MSFINKYNRMLVGSSDWSGIELVLIGDASGDPGFREAFGQLPYKDMHTRTAANVLSVLMPEITSDLLKSMNHMSIEQIDMINPRLRIKPNGDLMMSGSEVKKFWRNEAGKNSNFNYWYSGALSTVGENLGWTSEQMWAATEAYRLLYPVAEQWRVDTIEFAKQHGYVELPDGTRRVKYEATEEWLRVFNERVEPYLQNLGPGARTFHNQVTRTIRTRAYNQIVNARIQGTCAALMKRSIPKINKHLKSTGHGRVMAAIHDEIVFNVHPDHVLSVKDMIREIMCDHHDIVKTLPLHCTMSLGRNFEPWHLTKAPYGQLELDEIQDGFAPIPEDRWGQALNDNEIMSVVEYLVS